MTGNNFLSQTQRHISIYTIKFYRQNEVTSSGLLLLAAFSQPIGDLYEWSGSLMELW